MNKTTVLMTLFSLDCIVLDVLLNHTLKSSYDNLTYHN